MWTAPWPDWRHKCGVNHMPQCVICCTSTRNSIRTHQHSDEQAASHSCMVPLCVLSQAVLLAERHSSEAAQEICTAGMRHWPWGQLPTKLASLTSKAAAGTVPPLHPCVVSFFPILVVTFLPVSVGTAWKGMARLAQPCLLLQKASWIFSASMDHLTFILGVAW